MNLASESVLKSAKRTEKKLDPQQQHELINQHINSNSECPISFDTILSNTAANFVLVMDRENSNHTWVFKKSELLGNWLNKKSDSGEINPHKHPLTNLPIHQYTVYKIAKDSSSLQQTLFKVRPIAPKDNYSIVTELSSI